ncbi:uncharacterized protein si:dkey-27h10.2 [Scomber scombrus]|nr:uncharacterized protein si:dkey-27h10.2 [Scomber scombrus]
MPSIGPSFFTLGVVMVTVISAQPTTMITTTTEINDQNSSMTDNITLSGFTTEPTSHTPNSTSNITSMFNGTTMSINNTSTFTPGTTKKGNESSTTATMTTPMALSPSQSAMSTTTKGKTTTTATPLQSSGDKTGIIVLVVIIIIAVVFLIACLFAKKRGRRYSVDFNSRPDDTNIPLSTMQPEMTADSASQNGLKTFESTEASAKEAQEPETKPLVQEEQKAEADRSAGDLSAESAAPAPSAGSSEGKSKEEVVEQSPPAPVEPKVEEKTDDEGDISNKTSVESLKETNENNSNNADVTQRKDWKLANIFWDVSLDSPV